MRYAGWNNMASTYALYLLENNEQELLRSSSCPHEVRRVAVSRKLLKRVRRRNLKLLCTKDNKNFSLHHLDALCLQLWLENPTHHTPWVTK